MLKKLLKKIFPLGLLVAGHRLWSVVLGKFRYIGFLRDWRQFRAASLANGDQRFQLSGKDFYPILHEKTSTTYYDRHYVYHPAWAARTVARIAPKYHTDISSTLHFCTMLSAFVPVKFYDYRPADVVLSDLTSERADLLALPFADNSVPSLSCMHTVEHIGLGRYGDPIDPVGDLKAMRELARVLTPGGHLLFVVPVGKPTVMFNAHRIYSYEQIIAGFSNLTLKEFTLLPDSGPPVLGADGALVAKQVYGCGFFWFTKL